jgi:hypothetical protein
VLYLDQDGYLYLDEALTVRTALRYVVKATESGLEIRLPAPEVTVGPTVGEVIQALGLNAVG